MSLSFILCFFFLSALYPSVLFLCFCLYSHFPTLIGFNLHSSSFFFFTKIANISHKCTVADPGFPRGGDTNLQSGGANLLFGQKFLENCVKMKEFGPRGGHASLVPPPLDPSMMYLLSTIYLFVYRSWYPLTCTFACRCVLFFSFFFVNIMMISFYP